MLTSLELMSLLAYLLLLANLVHISILVLGDPAHIDIIVAIGFLVRCPYYHSFISMFYLILSIIDIPVKLSSLFIFDLTSTFASLFASLSSMFIGFIKYCYIGFVSLLALL